MSEKPQYILFAIVGTIGIVILICVALFFFVDTSVYKPRVERDSLRSPGDGGPRRRPTGNRFLSGSAYQA